MKSKFFLLTIAVLLFGGTFWFMSQDGRGTSSKFFFDKEEIRLNDKLIRITDRNFEPVSITVKKGNRVVFINERGTEAWPASDLHPTHGIYPEFDPREPISPGQAWAFVFNKSGEWKYHDHLKPNVRGLVIVEE